jgi:AraC-like DNA-binding protein
MRVVSNTQLTLELQPGLLQRYSTLRQCLYHAAMNYSRGIKSLAADLDLSESELSRRLNPSEGDNRSCDVNLMVQIVDATGDLTPLHWLMARFLRDADARKQAAVDQLAVLMPQIAALLADAGAGQAVKQGGRR